ncbi:MAG: triphosphoribosyl-dephospho-CoA synthase [Thermoplasmata archaeon]
MSVADKTDEHPSETEILSCFLFDILSDKPGNVKPGHKDFPIFLTSAVEISRCAALFRPTGDISSDFRKLITECTEKMMVSCSKNTLFGAILLLAPYMLSKHYAIPIGKIPDLLDYRASLGLLQAYRYARPRVLPVDGYDIRDSDIEEKLKVEKIGVKKWMSTGVDKNLVARAYTEDFGFIIDEGVPALISEARHTGAPWQSQIYELKSTAYRIFCDSSNICGTADTSDKAFRVNITKSISSTSRKLFFYYLSKFLDPLVVSKAGIDVAQSLLSLSKEKRYEEAAELIQSHNINPGAVADLVFATALYSLDRMAI